MTAGSGLLAQHVPKTAPKLVLESSSAPSVEDEEIIATSRKEAVDLGFKRSIEWL